MMIGTAYFESKASADRYYREYGYPNADLQLEEGSIHIGPPPLNRDETLSIIPGEGRYLIHVSEKSEGVVDVNNLEDELDLLVVDGNKILLPEARLTQYPAIKKLMEKAGGKFDFKGYFKFPKGIDVADVLAALQEGEEVNGKKESQSFFTPEEVGYRVCCDAGPLIGKRVLEPSAGHGALADIAEAAGADVTVVENYAPNILALEAKGYDVIARDFLTVTPEEIGLFDVVVANPPFARSQDIEHIRHMWSFLKPGGCMSVIASKSWQEGTQHKQREFREFLNQHQAEISDIEAGAFKKSGTYAKTVHIRIVKSARQVDLPHVSFRNAAPHDQIIMQF
ncbi:hypothetical protein [Ralstonia pseudosolanacearum]|uniref:hypothetical protein n=1 Tax=Ralstonia pseudosolanacearum TaxID=1310165 RepID=UPI003CE90048